MCRGSARIDRLISSSSGNPWGVEISSLIASTDAGRRTAGDELFASERTVNRPWEKARNFLHRSIREADLS